MKDIENLDDIKVFVDEFYKRIATDTLLAPFFLGKNNGDWQPHLDRMYMFWNAALFGEKGYVGNPFSKHSNLQLTEVHFEKWLSHFNSTIDTYFKGAMAANAKWRATIMSMHFIRRLSEIIESGAKPIM